MRGARRRRWAAVASAAMVWIGLVPYSSPAEACSFIGQQIDAPDTVEAGAFLRVSGSGLFHVVGEVDSMCGGDYEIVAIQGLKFRVTFARSSGADVRLADARILDDPPYGAAATFAVPSDATSALVELVGDTEAPPVTVDVTGTVLTTTTTTSAPTSNPSPTQAAPADPVTATSTFTG